jgi:hypothetical protein
MKKPGEKSYKLDMQSVLRAIDRRDTEFYSNLTEDERKAFSSWMTMRWCSATSGYAAEYIMLTNELVNKDFMIMNKHPELQWQLFARVGLNKPVKHVWFKPPNAKKTRNAVQEWVAGVYPHLKADELELFMQINSTEQLQQLARDHGLSDKEIKEIWR